jgi:hypothetical protein
MVSLYGFIALVRGHQLQNADATHQVAYSSSQPDSDVFLWTFFSSLLSFLYCILNQAVIRLDSQPISIFHSTISAPIVHNYYLSHYSFYRILLLTVTIMIVDNSDKKLSCHFTQRITLRVTLSNPSQNN